MIDLSNDAVANQFARYAKFRPRTLLGACLKYASVFRDLFDDGYGFVNVMGKGFFAIDIFSRSNGSNCRISVPVIRCDDANGVNVIAGD
jgi:hypothetical protein